MILEKQWLQARQGRAGFTEAALLAGATQAAQAGLRTPRLAVLVTARTRQLVGLVAAQLFLFCAGGTTLSLFPRRVGAWCWRALHGVAQGHAIHALAPDTIVQPPAVPLAVDVAVQTLAHASACWWPMEWAGCVILANGAAGSGFHDGVLAVGSRACHEGADLVAVQACAMAALISPHASIITRARPRQARVVGRAVGWVRW